MGRQATKGSRRSGDGHKEHVARQRLPLQACVLTLGKAFFQRFSLQVGHLDKGVVSPEGQPEVANGQEICKHGKPRQQRRR